jgi:AcrR family transcriptional regulator
MYVIETTSEETDVKLQGKLERNKARRREAIIKAARALIRETKETGLSMRALAARAGVSLATPYNLFGCKQAVLVALLHTDARAFGKIFESKASANKLSRIFQYIDMSFDLYRSDPEYYRVLLRTISRSEDADLRARLRKPRVTFLKTLLGDAVSAGHLETNLSVDLVSRELFGIYLHAVQEWVHGASSLDRARLETGYGYSLVLLGAAADTAKPELMDWRDRSRTALETGPEHIGTTQSVFQRQRRSRNA